MVNRITDDLNQRDKERIEAALRGDIIGFAGWLDRKRPLTGDWWQADDWTVDLAAIVRALNAYVHGDASERDIAEWATFLILGGTRGPAPPGTYLLTIPIEFASERGADVAAVVSRISYADMDQFKRDDAVEALSSLT